MKIIYYLKLNGVKYPIIKQLVFTARKKIIIRISIIVWNVHYFSLRVHKKKNTFIIG